MDATMSDDEGSPDADPDRGAASVDYDVLDRIGERLAPSARFDGVELGPEYAPDSLVVEYDLGYFPALLERAHLRIRWYENDDFDVHYAEQYGAGDHWECRWDRHTNDHNAREHFHPPPDAETPGLDESYPTDWRDVLTMVLTNLDERIEAFWE